MVRFARCSRIIAQLVCVLIAGSPASAGEDEINAAQMVIDGQIKAFLSDDNATAYSYASPTIKNMFPSVEAFMNMVTRGYQPVWKPRNYSFGKSVEIENDQIIQQLLVTGPDGKEYEAIYTLQRQADGSYKITGVHLQQSVSTGA